MKRAPGSHCKKPLEIKLSGHPIGLNRHLIEISVSKLTLMMFFYLATGPKGGCYLYIYACVIIINNIHSIDTFSNNNNDDDDGKKVRVITDADVVL